MPQLFVQVTEAGAAIGLTPQIARLTPESSLGVLCRGMVYPLRSDYSADVSGPEFYPADCPSLLDLAAFPALEDSRAPHHLLVETLRGQRFGFQGSEALLACVLRAAASLEWKVSGFGRWRQEMLPDGDPLPPTPTFDWFVDTSNSAGLSAVEVDNALHAAVCMTGPTSMQTEDPLGLRSDIALMSDEIAALHARLLSTTQSHEAEFSAIVVQANILRAALTRYRDLTHDAEATRAILTEKIENLIAQPPTTTIVELSSSIAADELELAYKSWQESETALGNARAELAALEEELASLRKALEARRAVSALEPKQSASGRKLREQDIRSVLGTVFPTISIDNDSVSFLVERVPKLDPILALLSHIHARRKDALQSAKVKAADGWFECHYSTGLSHDGRIYFSWAGEGTGAGPRVIISNKAQQEQDFRKLCRR